MNTTTAYFDGEEKEILEEVESFHKVLTHLQFEGKMKRGQNLKAAKQSLGSLMKTLKMHRLLQEKIIFPFLLRHIPKHESVISFLHSDHEDILKNKEELWRSLSDFSTNHNFQQTKVQQLGIYLVCLLRHHMELEKKSIHKAINKELRTEEKREVGEKIEKWLDKFHRNGK